MPQEPLPLRVAVDPSNIDGGALGRPPIVVEVPRNMSPDQIPAAAIEAAKRFSVMPQSPPLTDDDKSSIIDPVLRAAPEVAGFAQMIPGMGPLGKVAQFFAPGVVEAVRELMQGEELSGSNIIARTALNAAPKMLAQGARIPQAGARGAKLVPASIAAGGRKVEQGTELPFGEAAPSSGLPEINYSSGATSYPQLAMQPGKIGLEQGKRLMNIVRKEGITTSEGSFQALTSRVNGLRDAMMKMSPQELQSAQGQALMQELNDTYTLFGLLQQSRNKSFFGGGTASRLMSGASVGGITAGPLLAAGVDPQLAALAGFATGLPAALANVTPGAALRASQLAEGTAKYGVPLIEGAGRTVLTAKMAQEPAKLRRRKLEPK